MIETLHGRISSKTPDLLLQVGPLGMRLEISGQTRSALPDVGVESTVFTELHVREDALNLIGFATREEREVYRVLTSISGVGKRLALAILSELTTADLALAVSRGDEKGLTGISGVGKKTASRLLLELSSRLEAFLPESDYRTESVAAAVADPHREEALLALVALGLQRAVAERALAVIKDEDLDVEELIRRALSGEAAG
ncbi:MAG: Holliday junction branch migration protein RuvA [bacterium]|nr:Holliday junction branch migration protein RuvA [bacterium]